MWFSPSTKCTRLKDRDYDVTPYIIAHLCAKCTRGWRRFARCSVEMVVEEWEVARGGNVDCSVECDMECTMVTSGGDI